MPGETMTQAPTKTPFQDWMAGVVPPPSPAAIMQLGIAFWGSKTLLSAVELGLFTELAGRAARAEALRERLGLHPRARATSSTRWWRWACSSATTARYAQYAATTDLSSTAAKPQLHRRHAGDGERPALPLLGRADRGAAHRPAAERGQGTAATSSPRSTPTRRGSRLPPGDDRPQRRRRRMAIAAKFPWDGLPDASSTSAPPRAACRSRWRWPTRT